MALVPRSVRAEMHENKTAELGKYNKHGLAGAPENGAAGDGRRTLRALGKWIPGGWKTVLRGGWEKDPTGVRKMEPRGAGKRTREAYEI